MGAIILAALLVACQSGTTSGGGPEDGALSNLTDFDQLTAAFNQAEGKPRVVLLLSPT
ncbi:MAG TPA: hypothetical protein VLV83_15495 [Acidobacteriota bacterium]|nr:hypothetical protein [Acidobacteriota bacterium]